MGTICTNSFAYSRDELEALKASQNTLMNRLESESTIGLNDSEKEQRLKEIKEEVSQESAKINASRNGIKYFINLIMTEYKVSEKEAFAIFRSNDERAKITYDYMIQSLTLESIQNVLFRVKHNNSKEGTELIK